MKAKMTGAEDEKKLPIKNIIRRILTNNKRKVEKKSSRFEKN